MMSAGVQLAGRVIGALPLMLSLPRMVEAWSSGHHVWVMVACAVCLAWYDIFCDL